MRPIQDAFALLQQPKKIFITTHHKPDGDAIGSMLALWHYLSKKGHKVMAVSPGEIPDFLEWIPGVKTMLNYEEQPNAANDALKNAHLMAADLKQKGLDHSRIHEEVYETWSEKRMSFLGYVLIERMEVFRKYNTALIALSRKDMKLFSVQSGDTEGIVNYPLCIRGI